MENQAHVNHPFSEELLSRARGCFLGQLAGDSLGGLVEFRRPEEIRRKYPTGLRELMDGGTWDTIARQPTDDSEMALALARMLVRTGTYDSGEAKKAYLFWLDSGPFDCGGTILFGLKGLPGQGSQANGAMMRISPLGIFGVNYPLEQVDRWAMEDAAITHPNPVCGQANSLFARAIACGISAGCTPAELYNRIAEWTEEMDVSEHLRNAVVKSADEPPEDYLEYHGWVIIAFHNALWQLLHAENLESGVVGSCAGEIPTATWPSARRSWVPSTGSKPSPGSGSEHFSTAALPPEWRMSISPGLNSSGRLTPWSWRNRL